MSIFKLQLKFIFLCFRMSHHFVKDGRHSFDSGKIENKLIVLFIVNFTDVFFMGTVL